MSAREKMQAAIDRRRGDAEHAASLNAIFDESDALFTTCQKCGGQVTGSLEQIKAHTESCFADLIGERNG